MNERTLNPDYIDAVKKMLKNTPYFQLLGMEMEHVEPGRAVFIIPAQTKHLNPASRVHGGVFASIMDAAIFWSVYSNIDEGWAMTTADLSINYLAPAEADRTLRATGTAIKWGRTLGLGEARLEEAETGRLVGFATSTCMVIKAPASGPYSKLPPKFL